MAKLTKKADAFHAAFVVARDTGNRRKAKRAINRLNAEVRAQKGRYGASTAASRAKTTRALIGLLVAK